MEHLAVVAFRFLHVSTDEVYGSLAKVVGKRIKYLSILRNCRDLFEMEDFSCATCHGDQGKRIRMQELPDLRTHEGAIAGWGSWPAYRVSNGQFWTMQHRLNDCFRQQRTAEPIYGSDALRLGCGDSRRWNHWRCSQRPNMRQLADWVAKEMCG